MGSRGGGRGRGGRFGGGGFRHAKTEPYELFPEIKLTAINKAEVEKNMELVKLANKLHQEIKDLPYFLRDKLTFEEESVDIERYSGNKRSRANRVSLENSGYMTLQPGYFPLELLQGTKRRVGRKVQWNPKRDLKKLDFLEELEHKFKGDDSKDKKDGEEEDEEDLEEDVDDSDDDYAKNPDFDDDDDDYNQEEEADEEGGLM